MGFMQEFMQFMKEQKVISVALAFIVGIATAALVQSLVKDIITPIYAPYTSFLDPTAAVTVGASKFMVGDFISQLLNWVIILLVVFFIGKAMVDAEKKMEAVEKRDKPGN
jgi:large conductance mechanosensitive channel